MFLNRNACTGTCAFAICSTEGLLQLSRDDAVHALQLLWVLDGALHHWECRWALVWLVSSHHLPGCWHPDWLVGLVSLPYQDSADNMYNKCAILAWESCMFCVPGTMTAHGTSLTYLFSLHLSFTACSICSHNAVQCFVHVEVCLSSRETGAHVEVSRSSTKIYLMSVNWFCCLVDTACCCSICRPP